VRSHRALRPLILSLLALAAVALAGDPGPAAAASTGSGAVTVALTSLSPAVAVKGSTLHLAGNVVGGASAHSNVTIRLAVADIQVRSDMESNPGVGSMPIYDHDDVLGALGARATATWSLTVPVSALGLTSRNVYALDVEAYAAGVRIGAVRTYVPYAMNTGDSSFHATQLVVLWPVTAAPALDGQADKDVPESFNDALSTQFAGGGRLDKVLSTATAANGVTVSWAVDPDLLATAESESHGYSLYPNGTSGVGAQTAASWLAEAKSALSGTGELWQLPASDPDLGSLSKANSTLTTAAVKSAVTLSGTTLDDLVGKTARGTLAWPADGQVDSGTLNVAKAANPSAVIADSTSLDLHTQLDSYTPTGRATASTGSPLAISDSALDAIFAGDSADAQWKGSDQSLLASQRFLAQSALIAMERPNLSKARTIMVTASRTATPSASLLTAVGEASWIKTVGLSTLLSASPDSHAQTGTPKRAATTAATDLTTGQLGAATSLNSSLRSLAAILTRPQSATDLYGPAALRTLSTAWRSSAANQAAFTAAVRSRLDTIMGAVSLVPKSDLTLSGKSGVIPFTIENRFTETVNVGIRITTDHAGLTVQSITVQKVPQGSAIVYVHVSSAVSGTRVIVTAQLVTPGGADYGAPQSLQVTVSSIGSITLVIFGLSAALLVVAVGLRIYRSRRTRTAQAAPDPSGGSVHGESGYNTTTADAERGQ
jgi:hypothetical protein